MCRKSYLLALVVIIAFIGLVISDSSADYVCGDANGDGLLNVSDAVFIINHVFVGGPAPDPDCCVDCPATVTDYDGNVYQTVLIGGQCWMMDNLKVTHYRNGDPINHVVDYYLWGGLTVGAYCNFGNDEGNVAIYGRLYNGYAMNDSRGIAPEGWHVPSDAEWQTLVDYLGGDDVAGGKLKDVGTTYWLSPNTGATNESGFTALPGGYRDIEGEFRRMGHWALFWSSTNYSAENAWNRILEYDNAGVFRTYYLYGNGHSIRCVKD
jgi:uncharacterized protein (TIGR02145 family)